MRKTKRANQSLRFCNYSFETFQPSSFMSKCEAPRQDRSHRQAACIKSTDEFAIDVLPRWTVLQEWKDDSCQGNIDGSPEGRQKGHTDETMFCTSQIRQDDPRRHSTGMPYDNCVIARALLAWLPRGLRY